MPSYDYTLKLSFLQITAKSSQYLYSLAQFMCALNLIVGLYTCIEIGLTKSSTI